MLRKFYILRIVSTKIYVIIEVVKLVEYEFNNALEFIDVSVEVKVMLENLETLFKFIGGLGMFLYGMNVMADGLQKSAGNKMKTLLGYLTNNRLLAVIVGALITAIIQSSSATTIMVVGFVNAGLMNLVQAVGVIMGANIGTTITSWIVSMSEWSAALKPEFIAPLLIGLGAFGMMFCKKEKIKEAGEIFVGFGVLFIGLSFMSGAIAPYTDLPIFSKAFSLLGRNPILGVLTGAVVTAIIQSSSASVGILQTLALNGVVTWNSAVYITLGQNIGTCVTALISSAGANKTAKRAATIHLLFNMIGSILFGVIMFILFVTNGAWANSTISMVEISLFHTIFNITCTVLLFPFAKQLVKLSGIFIDDSEEATIQVDDAGETLKHLDNRILETPSFAVEAAIKEVIHMGHTTLNNVRTAMEALLHCNEEKIDQVVSMEKTIDLQSKLITEYLIKISNLSLTEKQHFIVNNLFNTVSNIERVGDHAENLAELAQVRVEGNISFSDEAISELKEISETAIKSFESSILARETEETDYIRNVIKYEDMVDTLEEEFRENHIKRLSKNNCDTEAGILYIDTLVNLERISDHSMNIAGFVKNEME